MSNTDKNIRSMVFATLIPKIVAIRESINIHAAKLLGRILNISGAATGSTELSKTDYTNTIQIPITIADDSHDHHAVDIAGSVPALPTTLVKRTATGTITGAGSSFGNTGFKVSDGRDITELFKNAALYPYTTETIVNGSGNYISGIQMTIDGNNKITLSQNVSSFCPVNRHPDVNKDGC